MIDNNNIEKIFVFIIALLVLVIAAIMLFLRPKDETITTSTYVKVSNSNINLKVGEKTNILVKSNIEVTFSSLNPNIVTVDQNGEIVALSSGDALIIVKSIDQKAEARVNVTVIKDSKIEISKVEVESSNDLSKNYVKKGDNLIITINFKNKLDKRLKVLVNSEELSYTFTSNQKYIIVEKSVSNENNLALKIYDDNDLIYTYDLPKIDNQKPKCTLKQSGEYLKIEGTDNYLVAKYSISQDKTPVYGTNMSIKINKYGTWYGYVMDYAGNEGSCSITISKPQTNPEPTTPVNPEPKPTTINPANITLVGDSRTVGICENNWYIVENGTCIAKIGMGYNWFISEAIPKVDALSSDKKKYIVVNLGGNDLENINAYLAKYKELATGKWKNYMIFLESVNPTDGEYAYGNGYIDDFNSKIKNLTTQYSNMSYCDTNTYLKQHGFKTFDGIHYYENVSKAIYEQTKKCIYDYYN